ncbi:oligoribonuclease [Curtobacterium sp. RRHDQ10]|uniref:oligoribonuclease n=1 Tax=Curtobacterium phyllosphaerae TaxID=3413379 RepID=UPI003BF0E8CF
MSEITINEGDEYTAIYHGGPFDGTTDSRTATSDTWETEVTAYAGVEGLETAFTYTATGAKQVLDQVHVDYAFDPKDSDPVDDLDERGDRSGSFDRE